LLLTGIQKLRKKYLIVLWEAFSIENRPETPQTIAELEIALINYRPIERFYKGTVLSDNGYRAVLFTTDSLLDVLATATEIFMDGMYIFGKQHSRFKW